MKTKIATFILTAICFATLANEETLNQSKILARKMVIAATPTQLNAIDPNAPTPIKTFYLKKITAATNEQQIITLTNSFTAAGIKLDTP